MSEEIIKKQRSHTSRLDRTRKQFMLPLPLYEVLQQREAATGLRRGELIMRALDEYCHAYDTERARECYPHDIGDHTRADS